MTLLEMKRARARSPRGRHSSRAPWLTARVDAQGERQRHVPVLAAELLELLNPQPGQTAIDCTFGDGGHARLLAERLGSSGTLVAIDRDPRWPRSDSRHLSRRCPARCASYGRAMPRGSSCS